MALYPPAVLLGWLPNDVPAGRGLAVAWLKRGECRKVLELGVPVTVLTRGQEEVVRWRQ